MGKAIIDPKIARRLRSAAGLLAGNLLLAFSVNYFFIPNDIMSGGATGVSLILYRFFSINTSVTIFVINGILLIIGSFVLGKNFLISTAASSMLYPLFLGLLSLSPLPPLAIEDMMVRIICAGFTSGLGIGLVIRAGGSTGGSDELALILNKVTSFPVTTIMTVADTSILLSAIFFSEPQMVIYSIISMLIEVYTISRVTIAGKSKIQLFIVSGNPQKMKRMLLSDADAGVTMIRTESGYLGVESEALLCIIPRRKLYRTEECIYRIDENAFITVTEINEVRGNGFSWERSAKNALSGKGERS